MKFRILALVLVLVAGSVSAWWFGGKPLPSAIAGPLPLVIAPEILEFENIRVGTSDKQLVSLTNIGEEILELTELELEGPFSAFLGPKSVFLDSGETQFLAITFTPTEEGQTEGSIAIRDAQSREASSALTGTSPTPHDVALWPRSIRFGDVSVGNDATALLTIENRGSLPFTLPELALADGFHLEPLTAPLAPGARETVKVRFSPLSEGRHDGELLLRDDVFDRDLAVVSLAGDGIDFELDVAFGAAPQHLDFGTVPLGSARKGWLTLSNSGRDPVTLTSVAVPEGFSAPEGSRVIGAGSKLSYPITFRPTKGGDHAGLVQFATNTPGGDPVGVALAAIGGALEGSGAEPQTADSRSDAPTRKNRFGFFGTNGEVSSTADVASLEPEFLEPVGEVPEEFGEAGDGPVLGQGTFAEGSDLEFIGLHADVADVHVGEILVDRQSGRVELNDLQLPKVLGPFHEWWQVVPTDAFGTVNELGDIDVTIPIQIVDAVGMVVDSEIRLTTGVSELRDGDEILQMSGQPLDASGAAKLVSVTMVPSGHLKGGVMRVNFNVLVNQ